MKYTLTINQLAAFNLGFLGKLDLIDLCLFDAFKSFANSAGCEKLIDDGGIWFWISYGKIIDEMPFSGLTSRDAIYRRMKKLEACKIIKFHPNNQKMTKTFFQWGENYDAIERKQEGVLPTDEKPKVLKDLRMKNRTPTDEKPKVPTVEKSDNTNTIIYPYTNPVEGEREAEKTPSLPKDFDEMIQRVNAEVSTIEAEKEKISPVPAAPSFSGYDISDEADELKNGVVRRDGPNYEPTDFDFYSKVPLSDMLEDAPVMLVQSFDGQTLPGALVTTVEGLRLEDTTRESVIALQSRLKISPKAENAMEAQKIIVEWCAVNKEQVVWSYESARRKCTAEDVVERIIDFCGHFSTTAEVGKQLLFFSDPARMFQNGLTKWLQRQNKFDREQSGSKFATPTEQKSNLPKSIRRY